MIKNVISVVTVISFLMLTGCETVQNTIDRIETSELTGKFDETFISYSKHLRWGHFRELTTFMTTEHIAPTLLKAELLKGRKISRVTPSAWVFNEEEGVMVGEILVDYYIIDRGVIRSTTQSQTWRYKDERWKLDNGLPDLP
jgi:hypothetical protein